MRSCFKSAEVGVQDRGAGSDGEQRRVGDGRVEIPSPSRMLLFTKRRLGPARKVDRTSEQEGVELSCGGKFGGCCKWSSVKPQETRQQVDDVQRRANRALSLVQVGEL